MRLDDPKNIRAWLFTPATPIVVARVLRQRDIDGMSSFAPILNVIRRRAENKQRVHGSMKPMSWTEFELTLEKVQSDVMQHGSHASTQPITEGAQKWQLSRA
ncbi:hypothetical protein [Caballeronia sp. J97]|uniref:hypothetical protein n=1 Tax=Caballeronia sp. J97 TaxID=2805429 RepID=UPI002AAF63B2|nr:hypothetical protein [Caballeronia sp. J97]